MPDLTIADPGWYCFKALPKKEHIAAELLRHLPGVETFCPRISYIKKTRRGKVRFVECLFPAYVFVYTDIRQTYRQIRSTLGIRDVVAFGHRVPSIPAEFIEELRQHLDEAQMKDVPQPDLKPGQAVLITDGPFRNMQAVVSGQLNQHQRVALLLDFLGRQMEVNIPVEDLLVEADSPKKQVWED